WDVRVRQWQAVHAHRPDVRRLVMANALGRRPSPRGGSPAVSPNGLTVAAPDPVAVSKAYLEERGYAVTKRPVDRSFGEFLRLVRRTKSNIEVQRSEARRM